MLKLECTTLQEKPQTLKSFAAYGEWTKQLHFSDPAPKVSISLANSPLHQLHASNFIWHEGCRVAPQHIENGLVSLIYISAPSLYHETAAQFGA